MNAPFTPAKPSPTPESRICRHCNETRPVEDFRFDNVAKGLRKTRCRSCERQRMRDDRRRHGPKRRAMDSRHYRRTADHHYLVKVKRTHGLTEEQAAIAAAATECDICGRDNGAYRLNVDHCHSTGTVRGMLCSRCNFALGQFGDDPALMHRAADYLQRNGEGRWGA